MTRPIAGEGFPLLIAEVANCHGGDADYLARLTQRLAEGRADAVKFQPIVADELLSPLHRMYPVFRELEMTPEVFVEASARLRAAGKEVAFDVYGERSLEIALECGANLLKIHASDIEDLKWVARVAAQCRPVLLSAGGATPEEVDRAVKAAGDGDVCVMVGFQSYPTPAEEAQLARIGLYAERYGFPVGYMDHVDRDDSFALLLPCLALQYGAATVEKHVYLKDAETRYDSESALDPDELDVLRDLMERTLLVEGTGFEMSEREAAYGRDVRKVACARRDLAVGEVLTDGAADFLRSEAPEGERPLGRVRFEESLGRCLGRDVSVGEPLTEEALA